MSVQELDLSKDKFLKAELVQLNAQRARVYRLRTSAPGPVIIFLVTTSKDLYLGLSRFSEPAQWKIAFTICSHLKTGERSSVLVHFGEIKQGAMLATMVKAKEEIYEIHLSPAH